ncbi:outer membrane protein transport protein [Breoghania sp. L-A4]|uniref:OmpP1/FadL family transporter n=1 Tax=Breoghania sp. L-A4 TaxID=2304600 RepID=UPI0019680555|nr:outer membrane protein transport protein [Breoghania sp. L-A4]
MLEKRAILLATVAMAIAGTGDAFAGAFALREQSAYYQGMSFAGNAAGGPSISSMFWNSATVTNTKGFTAESNSTFIVPEVEITPDATVATAPFGGSGDMGSDAWVPASYFGYQVNEEIYLGLAVNSQFGLSTKAGPDWSGQVYARTSEVFSVNANPIVGYKFNDMISVAMGLQVQYLDVRLTRALGVAPGTPGLELTGDDFGFGFTAGVTVTPMQGTDIGLGFRSGSATSWTATLRLAVLRHRSLRA